MRRLTILIAILLMRTVCLAEAVTFPAKIHRYKSPQNRVLVDKIGVLTFDDVGRKLTFKDDAHDWLEIQYDDVAKVLFEVTTHVRGMTPVSIAIGAIPGVGMAAGPAVSGKHVHDYWVYLEYKDREQNSQVLLEVPHDS